MMAYRVLVVDDSPAMRVFVRRVLRSSGMEVAECHEAGNGRQALDLLRKRRVDLILTDINMPEMDGEELLRSLKADEMLRSIPVFVISTDATEHSIARMRALGASGYVTKPFLPEDLRRRLEASLGELHA
jgi:two-component system chemotaxis response regulator CheY